MNRTANLLGIALSVSLTLAPPAQAQSGVTQSCTMDFEVAVRLGPSAGTVLDGEFSFTLDRAGTLSGSFVLRDGRLIPVTGQATGRLIGLSFDMGNGKYLWGSGAGSEPIAGSQCGAAIGGTFAGPDDGDIGDWKPKGKPRPGTLN